MDVDLIVLILIVVTILVGLGTIAATVMLLVRDQPETSYDDPANDDPADEEDEEPDADDEPFEDQLLDESAKPAETSASPSPARDE
jgi:hypothetical protein